MNESYQYVFLRHHKMQQQILEYYLDISPIYKYGWNFSFFNWGDNKREEDPSREQIRKDYSAQNDEIIEKYRIYSDSIKKWKGDSTTLDRLTNQKEKLSNERKRIRKAKKEAIEKYDVEKTEQILEALKSLVKISIDSVDYSDSLLCHYGKHPETGDRGLICNFDVSHLSKGYHSMQVFEIANYSKDRDTITTRNYALPFIKQF